MEPAEPRRSGWPANRWIAAFVAVAVVAGIVALGTGRDDAGGGHPHRWDRRLADLVAFVEDTRGLQFRHPVTTRFLPDGRFRAAVTGGDERTAEEDEELEHYEGVLRALGLVAGELDLRAAADTLAGEGIFGVYLPERDEILIRGRRITPAMRPTIVHELTHALQAQHFDLERGRGTSGEDLAFRALVEADAGRVEREYVGSLPENERAAVEADQRSQAEAIDIEGVAPILTELFSLPYVFGPPFLEALRAEGERRVDQAFREPPTTEEHLLEPASYLDGDEPLEVRTPRLGPGERRADEPSDFGMLSMLLVLGERVPFGQAWAAVDGWAGDASISFRAEGRDCIRIRTRLDTTHDAEQLLATSRAWLGDATTGEVRRTGDAVVLTSCDPGSDAAPRDPDRPRTFDLVQLRAELVASLGANGVPGPVAACAADRLLREEDPAALLAVGGITDPGDPRIVALQRRVVAAVEGCAGG